MKQWGEIPSRLRVVYGPFGARGVKNAQGHGMAMENAQADLINHLLGPPICFQKD